MDEEPLMEKKDGRVRSQTIGQLRHLVDLGAKPFGEDFETYYGKPSGCTRYDLKEKRPNYKVIR